MEISFADDLPFREECNSSRPRQVRNLQHHNHELVVDLLPVQTPNHSSKFRPDYILEYVGAAIGHFLIRRDQTWVHLYFSSGCYGVLGYSAQELHQHPGLWQSEIYTEDWNNTVKPVLEKLLVISQVETQSSHMINTRYRFRRSDGSLVLLATSLTCRYNSRGDYWEMMATQIDISDLMVPHQVRDLHVFANASDITVLQH